MVWGLGFGVWGEGVQGCRVVGLWGLESGLRVADASTCGLHFVDVVFKTKGCTVRGLGERVYQGPGGRVAAEVPAKLHSARCHLGLKVQFQSLKNTEGLAS